MEFPLITGSFTPTEAIDLLSRLADVKIRFHEDKISKAASEEDISMREARIKVLQDHLAEAKAAILAESSLVTINCMVRLLNR
jgi:hypothetical protein